MIVPTKAKILSELKDTTATLRSICESEAVPALIDTFGTQAFVDGILAQVALAEAIIKMSEVNK